MFCCLAVARLKEHRGPANTQEKNDAACLEPVCRVHSRGSERIQAARNPCFFWRASVKLHESAQQNGLHKIEHLRAWGLGYVGLGYVGSKDTVLPWRLHKVCFSVAYIYIHIYIYLPIRHSEYGACPGKKKGSLKRCRSLSRPPSGFPCEL